MKPLCFVWNVEDGKEFGTPLFRRLALLNMLLCAGKLRAIGRKTSCQGRQINRPIAITCLRPLVGVLSAVVAAILLYASSDADAQSQPAPMLGIFYLENSDAAGDPPYNWSTDQGLTNPYVQGIA